MEAPVSQEPPPELQTPAEIYIQEELQAQTSAIELQIPLEATPAAKPQTLAPAHQQLPTSSLLQAPAPADRQNTTNSDTLVPAVSPEQPTIADLEIEKASSSVLSGKKHQRRSGRKSCKETECREYVIQFKGNNSKQWDGKTIPVDGEWLEELYDMADLFPGRIVELPWRGKDGKDVSWKAVLLSLPAADNEGKFFELEVAAWLRPYQIDF